MRIAWQDIRECLRRLGKRRGLTAIALLTTAVGIGASSKTLSSIETKILSSKAARDAGQILVMATRDSEGPASLSFSYPMRLVVQKQQKFAREVSAGRQTAIIEKSVCTETDERVRGELVSGNYFDVLGARARVGRLITEGDEGEGVASPVVVISFGLWKRRFGMDPSVVGRTITLNGYQFRVIGVTEPSFVGIDRIHSTDIQVPLTSMRAIRPPVLRASRANQENRDSL